MEPIDLSAQTQAICDRLDLRRDTVAELLIRPSKLDAVVYLLNDDGKKYITEADEAATEVRHFDIRT